MVSPCGSGGKIRTNNHDAEAGKAFIRRARQGTRKQYSFARQEDPNALANDANSCAPVGEVYSPPGRPLDHRWTPERRVGKRGQVR